METLEPRTLFAADLMSGLAGDYNNSGQVDQGDLDLVLQHWGTAPSQSGAPLGWMQGVPTGLIGQTELDRVLQNWGNAYAPSGVEGDFDNSGQVDQGDLDLVLQNWGRNLRADGVPAGWINDGPSEVIEQEELDRLLQNWGARAVQSADKIVSWFTIGWAGTNPDHRYIGRNLPYLGWSGFVERDVIPQIEGGVRRIMLHNPFGVRDGEPMQLDQLLHAQEEGLDFATEGFVEAWKPITDMGIEVIAYVGSGREDPDFDSLLPDKEAWLQRAFQSTRPLRDAGMSIALDFAAPAAFGSPTHTFATLLRGQGFEVYIEAKPNRWNTHWHDYGVISLDQTFLDDDIHTGNPQAADYGIDNSLLTGEILRITKPRRGETITVTAGASHQERVREIIVDGHVAVTDLNYWFKYGRDLDDFITPTVVVG